MSGNGSVSCCAQPGALVVIAALPLCQLRDTLDSIEYQLFEGGFIPAGYGAEGACDWPDVDRLGMARPSTRFCLVPSRFDAHALWIAPMPCPLCRRSAMLCSDLLWDAQSVSRKQVPTLQDAFLCCDRETLLSMVEQGYARRLPGVGSGNSAAASRRPQTHGSRIGGHARLRGEAQKAAKALCIFPEERFVVHARRGQACIERLVQARVADLSAGAVRQDAAEGACLFGCAPWSQVLSYRVWLRRPLGLL